MTARFELPFQDSTAEDTVRVLQALTARRRSQRLRGDEGDKQWYTGRRRTLVDTAGRKLVVATYDPDAIEHMTDLVASIYKPDPGERWLGHIEFACQGGKTAIEGVLYASSQRVAGNPEITFDQKDWGKHRAQQVYAFAEDLGLGTYWNTSLSLSFRGQKPLEEAVLGSPQLDNLNTTLAHTGNLA